MLASGGRSNGAALRLLLAAKAALGVSIFHCGHSQWAHIPTWVCL